TARPVQWQSSVFGFALEHGIHGSFARACGNPSGRNIGVCLECQLNHFEPMLDEDLISLLANVAEWANEVVPVQHRSRVSIATQVGGFSQSGHLTPPTLISIRSQRQVSFLTRALKASLSKIVDRTCQPIAALV